MKPRLKQLISDFPRRKIDAFVVFNSTDIQYLTGFPSEDSWLLVTPKKVFYLTDFRYVLEAKKHLKGINIHRYPASLPKAVADICKNLKVERIGFEPNDISLLRFELLKKVCAKPLTLVKTRQLIEPFREIKDASEIQAIRDVLGLHKKTHQYLKRVVRPGLTEREVFLKLEHFVKSRGAGFSFSPIVASGSNSCFPHAKVTDRKIRNNEPVLIDMGIDLNGYKSDLTRMFFLGKISQLVTDVNDKVQKAQDAAIAAIKPGVTCGEVDAKARNLLKKSKLDKYFGHALGHGVGLDIHESPRLSQNNPSVLKPGMIITVEPAVYIPNEFGIRIEDMVLVTDRGCEILSDDIH